MKQSYRYLLTALLLIPAACAQMQPVTIGFRAVVGSEEFDCGRSYSGVGKTNSTIRPRDFRLYVNNVRLVDENGAEIPVRLDQDQKWQLDDVALLDFENGAGGCANGNPDVNTEISGAVPAGHTWKGLKFVVGVPFDKNHTDITASPTPLNMTALSWNWNAGRKFARIEFTSTGRPRGYMFHLGSTGCQPTGSKTTPATSCSRPNSPEIVFADFQPGANVVIADLGALLKDANVDKTDDKFAGGCMSMPMDADCAPMFASMGLPFAGEPARPQTFFRLGTGKAMATSARK